MVTTEGVIPGVRVPRAVAHDTDRDEVRPVDFGGRPGTRSGAHHRTPCAGTARSSPALRIVTLVIVIPTGVAAAGAPGEPSVQTALTTFKLASCAVLLVLGFALSLRYYVFNEARIGWLAMALMMLAMSQVTESVLLLAGVTADRPGRTPPSD